MTTSPSLHPSHQLEPPAMLFSGVRRSTPEDLDGVLQCDHLAASREAFLRDSVASGQCWVATCHDRIVGFLTVSQSFFGHEFISLVVVHQDFRRQGVARDLVLTALANRSTAKLFTSTNQSNTAAQSLFRSTGFEPSGVVRNLDPDDPELIFFHPG